MRAGVLLPALLLAVHGAGQAQTPTTGETVIRGVVFDSLRMRPLANASVQIAAATGTPWIRSYETDSNGTFEFAGVPNGTYLIGFFHAELDSLGLLPPTFRLDVRAGPPIHMPLAIPSARTITRSLCGRNGTSDSTGLFLGHVRGAKTSLPLSDGRLVLRWAEIVIRKGSIGREVRTVKASSGPDGLAVVCGLPVGTSIQIQGASAGDSSGAGAGQRGGGSGRCDATLSDWRRWRRRRQCWRRRRLGGCSCRRFGWLRLGRRGFTSGEVEESAGEGDNRQQSDRRTSHDDPSELLPHDSFPS